MCRLGKQPALCMQYVFVLLRGEGFYVGGHLWRSDQFGNGNWQDVTSKLTGQLLLLATAVSAGSVGHGQRHKLQTKFTQHLHASSVSSDLCSHQLRVLWHELLNSCLLA